MVSRKERGELPLRKKGGKKGAKSGQDERGPALHSKAPLVPVADASSNISPMGTTRYNKQTGKSRAHSNSESLPKPVTYRDGHEPGGTAPRPRGRPGSRAPKKQGGALLFTKGQFAVSAQQAPRAGPPKHPVSDFTSKMRSKTQLRCCFRESEGCASQY